MQGYVNAYPREPRLTIAISNGEGEAVAVEAVIDTGFTEFLSLPPSLIRTLGLERGQDMELSTAGGQVINSATYSATVDWHGSRRRIRVIDLADRPLIGMSLLWDSDIAITARENGRVSVSEIAGDTQ
jgi:clan AA aspartic protease